MTRVAVLASAALAALALAPAAGAATPAAGDYQAEPVLKEGGTFTYGLFSVVKDGRQRSIVASENRDGIYYPDIGKCDNLDLPLSATAIPISAAGRFKIKEKIEVTQSDTVTVSWRGRWRKAKRVSGEVTIKSEGCASTEDWRGRRIP